MHGNINDKREIFETILLRNLDLSHTQRKFELSAMYSKGLFVVGIRECIYKTLNYSK